MRYNDCKCGNDNFELERNGKLRCIKCNAWFNPFSAEHHKVIKEDGFHYFWAIFTPHFVERLDERLPGIDTEELLPVALAIEKKAKRKKFQCTRWKNKHLIWKYKYNERRRRLELEFVSVVPLGKNEYGKDKINVRLHTGYYVKDVEYVEVNFNE
tara:strand:- start:4516 stop:4980 length:465 start_codon:yes stop_codon:yes gene_type:complete